MALDGTQEARRMRNQHLPIRLCKMPPAYGFQNAISRIPQPNFLLTLLHIYGIKSVVIHYFHGKEVTRR
ncbi:MAG TPA: hypothetical protein DCP92_20280 [Nitrospiraceae bacterium]|nr:hypothetical protein [Nitrospiraceae bacterium]